MENYCYYCWNGTKDAGRLYKVKKWSKKRICGACIKKRAGEKSGIRKFRRFMHGWLIKQ